MEEDKQ
jgi:hypothetical protein